MYSKAEQKASEKSDYEILFKDSSEYFLVKNAKMIQEGQMIRFICFDSRLPVARFTEDQYYPIGNIHRIKRYAVESVIKNRVTGEINDKPTPNV